MAPYSSKAQQKFMHAAAERGEIKKSTVAEYDKATDFSKLPERVSGKKKGPKSRFRRLLEENS